MSKPTLPQAKTAFILATTFGHGWATSIVNRECPRQTHDGRVAYARSPHAVPALSRRLADLNADIVAEEAQRGEDCGLLFSTEHRTQSGTLAWSVGPDGTALISVYAGPDRATMIATVRVDAGGTTAWNHVNVSTWRGRVSGKLFGRHVNAADGSPLPGSDEYAYNLARTAVAALGGHVESQPAPRRLPRGRRALASIA